MELPALHRVNKEKPIRHALYIAGMVNLYSLLEVGFSTFRRRRRSHRRHNRHRRRRHNRRRHLPPYATAAATVIFFLDELFFTTIVLPSSSESFKSLIAACASSSLGISTNPKPLDLPVNLSMIILALLTSPNSSKVSSKCLSEVS